MYSQIAFILMGLLLAAHSHALQLILDESPHMAIDQPLSSLIVQDDTLIPPARYAEFTLDAFPESIQPSPNGNWYKIHLQADFLTTDPQKRTLLVHSHILRHLHLYLFDGDTLIKQEQLGIIDKDNVIRSTDTGRYQGPNFQFYIQNDTPLTLLIYKQNDGPSILPMSIYTDEGLQQITRKMNLFWGGIICILIVMALYNLIVYAMHPNKAYLWYLGFHSLTIFYFGGLNGFGYLIFPIDMQIWLSQNIMTLNFLVVFFIANFANAFLELKNHAPRMAKLILPISIASLAGAACSLWVAEYIMIPFFSILQTIASVFGISAAIIAYKNKFKPAKYFLVSWLFTITGGAIGMGTVVGAIPANFITLHGFLFGTLCELFFFSVALAHRMKDMENHLLSQSYFYPDTEIANFGYIKNKLPEYLPKLLNQYPNLFFFVSSHKGFKEIIGLYGPKALTRAYRQYTSRANHFLMHQPWRVPMPLPTGDEVFLAGLPGEQVFLMINLESAENEHQQLDNICNLLINHYQQPSLINQARLQLKVAAGCARFSDTGDVQECFRQAQIALLSCQIRKQSWMIYQKDHDEFFSKRSALVDDLQQAIQDEALSLYIQPQVQLSQAHESNPKQCSITGGEILLRWQHPKLGFVSPAEFIILAEQSGLIFQITQQVFRKVCIWLQHLQHIDPKVLQNLSISVNLSALDMAESKLLPFIKSCLDEHLVNSRNILLEVTESAAMDNPKAFLHTISELKKLGFRIAIDDFGTGYSSMQYLQTIQADEIKIDMAFIRDIHLDKTKQNIVQAITQLAHATGAHTVAEGIEHKAEAAYLTQLQCTLAQGYYWSRPIPLVEFENQFLFQKD